MSRCICGRSSPVPHRDDTHCAPGEIFWLKRLFYLKRSLFRRHLRPSMLQQLLRRLVFDVPLLTDYCKMPLRVGHHCFLSSHPILIAPPPGALPPSHFASGLPRMPGSPCGRAAVKCTTEVFVSLLLISSDAFLRTTQVFMAVFVLYCT